MKKRIGDILVEMGFLDQDQLKMALMETQKTGVMLGDVLRRLDWVTEEDPQMAIAVQSGAQILDSEKVVVDHKAWLQKFRSKSSTNTAFSRLRSKTVPSRWREVPCVNRYAPASRDRPCPAPGSGIGF